MKDAIIMAAKSRLDGRGRLDLGSGDGVLAELLAANSEQYVCVDNNAKAIKAAKDGDGAKEHPPRGV